MLRAIELIFKLYRTQLMPRVSHILKAFYDTDILDEKSIIGWGSKVHNTLNYIHFDNVVFI